MIFWLSLAFALAAILVGVAMVVVAVGRQSEERQR